MNYLRQSTATTVKFGPFVDASDGVTAEVALTIQKANVRVSKNGGNMAAASADQGAADAGAPHDEVGVYDGSLDATDTDTLGRLRVDIQMAGAAPWWDEWEVVPAAVYDALVAGTGNGVRANAVQFGSQTVTAAAPVTVPASIGTSTYAGGAVDSVTGDVGGKVLGGGAAEITGVGARVVDGSGNAVAPASAILTAQQTRDAMKLAPGAGDPTAGSVDKHLDDILEDTGTTLPALIAAVEQGDGANPVTITVTSAAAPVAGLVVVVWNSAQTGRVNYGTTDSNGQILVNLDAATYKVAVVTPSTYVNPGMTTLTVTDIGAQALGIAITAQSVTPPSGADQIVGVLDTYDSQGALEASVAITIKMLEGPGDTGQSHDTAEITATSNGSGRVTVSLLQGAKYKARRGSTSRWEEFTCPTTGTSFLLPEVLGTD